MVAEGVKSCAARARPRPAATASTCRSPSRSSRCATTARPPREALGCLMQRAVARASSWMPDDATCHRGARRAVARRRHRARAPSSRGTARRRSTGGSPPTTAGTCRRTSRPSARCAWRARPCVETAAAHPARRRRAARLRRRRRRRPDGRRGRERVAAADRGGLRPRRPADRPGRRRRAGAGHRAAADGASSSRSGTTRPCASRSTMAQALGRAPARRVPAAGSGGAAVGCRRPSVPAVCAARDALTERVVHERCELLLAGVADAGDDPAGFLLGVGELGRLGC